MIRTLLVTLVVIGLIFLVAPLKAHAQQPYCGDGAEMVDNLRLEYSEIVVATAVTRLGNFLTIFTSPKGSWTFLLTYPNGRTCVLGTGTDFQLMPVEPVPKGTAA